MEQSLEPVAGRFLAAEGERVFVEVDGRVQPGVLEVRRTSPLDDRCVHCAFGYLAEDVLLERVDQPRLAQPRLPDEQNDLAHAFLSLLPAILQKVDFKIAARQR